MIDLAGASTALAALAAKSSGGSSNALATFLPIVLIIAVFYFLIIRPQRRRAQQQAQLHRTLEPGAQVQTTFGLLATVVSFEDDEVVLEVAPGVHARFVRQVIGRVITPGEIEHERIEPSDDTGGAERDSTEG